MHPHAKTILFAVMVLWTVLTFIVGAYAVQGSSASGRGEDAAPQAATATAYARTPFSERTRTATDRTPGTARTALARTVVGGTPPSDSTPAPPDESRTAVPTATATNTVSPAVSPTPGGPTRTPFSYPVPRYVQNAGADGSKTESGGASAAAPRDAARSPAKGVVVLDPGHGRGDPGAVHHLPDGTPDVLEAESNLLNAFLIRDELAAMGYDVYLTRDGVGRGPEGPLAQQFITSDLIWRAQLADAVDADVFLALHGNGATVTSIAGPETWYCGQHVQGSRNAALAAAVQIATMDALHEYGYFPPDRGTMEDAARHHSGDFCQFVVTRETTVPSALLEYLFLSNDDDARVLADRRSHEILARHVAAAIDRFLSEPTNR